MFGDKIKIKVTPDEGAYICYYISLKEKNKKNKEKKKSCHDSVINAS